VCCRRSDDAARCGRRETPPADDRRDRLRADAIGRLIVVVAVVVLFGIVWLPNH
jgi:hypothetical protein